MENIEGVEPSWIRWKTTCELPQCVVYARGAAVSVIERLEVYVDGAGLVYLQGRGAMTWTADQTAAWLRDIESRNAILDLDEGDFAARPVSAS